MNKSEEKGTGFKIKDSFNSVNPVNSKVTEETYHIPPSLREDLEGVVSTISNIEKFGTVMGHRNYLFIGPPGTGKTLGVQYLASKLQCPFYDGKNISNPGEIEKVYKELRERVKKDGQKVILMLDEVDRFSKREDIIDPSQQQTLSKLLVEMDGVESNNGIFVFGMTNKPNNIDNALRRPGRFSKEIEFMPPNIEGREAILSIHAYGKDHQFEIDKEDLIYAASKTFGYTGADLRGLLDEAFTSCILREDEGDSPKVTREDFEKALKKTRPSALRDMPFREPQKKLEDIGGYESHKEVMKRIFDKESGSMVLFYGPPGCGKTEFAEALAGEYGFNYIVISGSEPEDKFVGETGKKIDQYLDRAKQLAPCILVFDELDALVEKKGTLSHKSSWTGLLQSKLSKPIEGVNIIGTMNRPDLINNTFMQRFPHKLYFGMPSSDEQIEIWQRYLPEGIDLQELIVANSDLSGRDIANTTLLIKDYGVKPTTKVYKHLIKNINTSDETDYEKIRKEVGDSIRDYNSVRQFLDNQEGGENES